MPTVKRYNWLAMGTSAEEIYSRSGEIRLGSREMPSWINWNATPQGGNFWAKGFMRTNLNAERALERMLAQVQRELTETMEWRYTIRDLAPSPLHILAVLPQLVKMQMAEPYSGIHWHKTPQGYAFWKAYFATPVDKRDENILATLFRAAKRAQRLKGLGIDV